MHSARQGLIPAKLDADRGTALWLDLGDYHFHEGSFSRSLAGYAAIRAGARHPSTIWQCESSLDFLRSGTDTTDSIYPGGFIFHAGRCGSTLLAKVLARSQEHLVFGEGGPHNQIWSVISGSSDPAQALFRNLLLHTGRRRLPSYCAHIVKFTAFNVVRWEFIRAAFPAVPALFLFRHPAQMLASYRRTPPGWIGLDTGIGRTWHSAEAAITDFFRAALHAGGNLACLDYADLTTERLPAILRFFHLDPPDVDVKLMRAEFSWDAKSNRRWSHHSAAVGEFDAGVSPDLLRLYEELRARRRMSSDLNDL